MAFTLQVGRQRFDERRALVVPRHRGRTRLLESPATAACIERRERLRERPVGYAFPGGDAWYPGAAAGLYRTEEAFRAAVDRCRTVLRPLLGTDVLEVITGAADEDLSPGVTACAAFTAEYALAALFAGWGLRPDTARGRGAGALTAAVVAGVLSLEDALGVLAEYARIRTEDAGTGDAAGALTSWIRAKATLAAPALPGAAPDPARATDPAYWAGLLLGTGPDAGTGDAPLGAGAEPPADPDLMVLVLGPADGSGEPDAETILPVLPDHARRHEAVAAAHGALARAWVLGAVVDWAAYHDGETRNRVPLPTYPFQRSRYWIDTPERAPRGGRPLPASGGTPGSRLAALPKLPTDQWLSVPGWRQLPPRAAGTDTGRWLLLTDTRGLTPALAARIRTAGGSAVIATPGDGFARTAADAFTLDPADAGQWSELFTALRAEDDAPLRVAHLWGVDPVPDTLRGTERATTAFHSLLALLQAAGGAGAAAPAAVTVITTGAFDVTGGEPVDPAKATVTGPCKVAPLEYPGLDVRHIDVTAPRGKKAAATLAQRLLPELTSAPAGPGERQLALRGRRRWAATHTPLPPGPRPHRGEVLRQEGVYLITGGLGGIGGAMAHRLATSVRATAGAGRTVGAARSATGGSGSSPTRTPPGRSCAGSRRCAPWRRQARRCWWSRWTRRTRTRSTGRWTRHWSASAGWTACCTRRVYRAWVSCSSRPPRTPPRCCGPNWRAPRRCASGWPANGWTSWRCSPRRPPSPAAAPARRTTARRTRRSARTRATRPTPREQRGW